MPTDSTAAYPDSFWYATPGAWRSSNRDLPADALRLPVVLGRWPS